MHPYNHKKIEKKWQERWEKDGLYEADDSSSRPKYYCLIEFPYPSGEGLHVGHIRSNTAMDIIARKRRAEGFNVLYPTGWDAFGLPTENYAIKTGVHPSVVTKQNTEHFRKQLKSLGFSFDWSREINTTDPEYYKWTQWIFLKLFENGLAYKKKMPINWCLSCKIGLANEEVVDGLCERCGGETEKRNKEQWMLKITAYADRLHKDLEKVDFLEKIKVQQRNWIGRSEGANIKFQISNFKFQIKDIDFVFLHGFKGSSKGNFWPWLKGEIEKRGGRAFAPDLPNSRNPVIDEQVEFLLKNHKFSEKTVIITHSLGGVVAMKLLPKLHGKIQELIMVAPPLKTEFLDGKKRSALEECCDWSFDFASVKDHTDSVVVLADSGDPIVPVEQPKEIAEHLSARFFIKNAESGHFDCSIEPEILNVLTQSIRVFTTRADTLFGATYLVLAPEHELIEQLLDERNNEPRIMNHEEVSEYIENVKKKTEIERMDEGKEKTGVELKGIKAINPANKEEIPIWIADYVLTHYGTGAIMAVPAHDERDYVFAKKYSLPIRQVIEPVYLQSTEPGKIVEGLSFGHRDAIIAIVEHWRYEKYLVLRWKKVTWGTFITGGIEDGQTAEEAAKAEILEETGYMRPKLIKDLGIIHGKFYHVPKKVNRFAHARALYFKLEDDKREQVSEDEQDKHEALWLSKEEVKKFLTPDSHHRALELLDDKEVYTGEGMLTNSGKYNEMDSSEAREAILKFVNGEKKVTYKLHDWVFSRQRYWGEPIPLVFCEHCAERIKNKELRIKDEYNYNKGETLNPGWFAVAEKHLPVTLPEVEKYKPTDTGESPLADVPVWVETTCPKCDGKAIRETDVMPNWAGSSWYYLAYIMQGIYSSTRSEPHAFYPESYQRKPKVKFSAEGGFATGGQSSISDYKEAFKKWMPVDWYNGGMEHTTLHLLYSRFWYKFLYDIGIVASEEPYRKRTSHGMVLAENGEKMSKSKGNIVSPEPIVEKLGADTVRLYEMFMGPFDQAIAWSTNNMVGTRRFLEKVWRLQEKVFDAHNEDESIENSLHRTIKKVTDDIETMKFNTAISSMMIFVNQMERVDKISLKCYDTLLRLLAPFAPHITEELWEKTAHRQSVHQTLWPRYDEKKTKEEMATVAIQVNGKVRGELQISTTLPEATVKEQALREDNIQKWIEGKKIDKIIYVKGKIVSIVATLQL